MKKFLNVFKAVACLAAIASSSQLQASVADEFVIPKAGELPRVGALMPYYRYDSQIASLGGGAVLKSSATMDRNNIASQASDQSYVELPGNGASAEWEISSKGGRGVTMRFTMPDTADGMGQKGSLDVYVNGEKVKTVDLSSYWMWQYFAGGNPSDTQGGIGCFAFDEVHFLLNKSLKEGDKIKIQSSGANGLVYGVDFLEIEEVPEAIERPAGAVSVEDFGAHPDDGQDDLAAFVAAVKAADAGSKVLYIPEGTWHLSGMWNIYCQDVKITGAGIWYTNLQFTSDKAFGGGISGGNGSNGGPDGYCKNLEFCNVYINSNLRSRYNQLAVYKCFMDVFTDGSVIHDIWEDHFECGFWIGDYNGKMDYADGVKIVNCRIRNNLADGVNFCQGTSNATVYNCSIRNNGDDGLAMWNDATMSAKDESNNVFAYNSIDFIWRAGGIAIYGGTGHKIYNNYIRDMFMASGIHLNTTFPGYKFDNNQGITFDNNILVHCGTNADSWDEDLAGIDLKQDVKNVTFNNTEIYNSPFDAIRTLTGPSNITFNNTKICGTGLTGESTKFSCITHTTGAIRYADKNVKFNGLKVMGYLEDKGGNNKTFPFWTDNNQDLANSLGAELDKDGDYEVPDYPYGGITLQPDDPTCPDGCDVELTALCWKNQNGGFDIKEGDKVSFTAIVKNVSDVDIPAKLKINVQVMIDGGSKMTLTLKNGLKAGESLPFELKGTWTATKGGHTAVATVDPQNVLDKELTKDNNTRTKRFNALEKEDGDGDFTPVTGGSDLVVTKVFVKDLDAINVGDHLVMGAVIANAGDKDIPAGSKIGVQFQLDGKNYASGFVTWCDTYKDGLKSHATAIIYANGGGGQGSSTGADNYFFATEGTHTITAWIDDTNNWQEVNENNNTKDLTLTIPFGGTQYFDNPDTSDDDPNPAPTPVVCPVGCDVQLTGLSWKNQDGNSEIKEGDKVTFSAAVKNVSNVDIPANLKLNVQVAIDGNNKMSMTLKDGLKAGELLQFKSIGTWTATKGGHTAVATIDPQNVLDKELTKDNNTRTKRFNAWENEDAGGEFTPVTGGYDLVVTKVFVKDLNAINVGDHLVMGAVIANAGDRDVPAGSKIGVQFLLDGKDYGTGYITWCDTYMDGLKSHATATLYANGGGSQWSSDHVNYFFAPEGTHTITAWIDDTDNWQEVNENNNTKDLTLVIPFGGIQYFDNPDTPDDLVATLIVPAETTQGADLAPYYTIEGVKVNAPKSKGLYIHKGKKIVIR